MHSRTCVLRELMAMTSLKVVIDPALRILGTRLAVSVYSYAILAACQFNPGWYINRNHFETS